MDMYYLFSRSVQRYGDKTALIDDRRQVSYNQLSNRVNQLANGLRARGVGKGDRVCLLMNNSICWVESDYALAGLGAVRTRLNARDGAREYRFVVNDVGAKAVIFGAEFWGTLKQVLADLPTVETLICIGKPGLNLEDLPDTVLDYEELIAGANESFDPEPLTGDDLYTIMHTSGTTGNYRGAVYSHQHWINATVRNTLLDPIRDISDQDVFIHVAPLTHMSGCLITPTLMRGSTNVILEKFEPPTFLQAVQDHRASMTILAPTIIGFLLNFPDLDKYDVSSLRTILYAASPIAPSVLERAIKAFGNVFYQGYGLTESLFFVTGLEKVDHDVANPQRLLSCGRELTSARIRIVDGMGHDVPDGDEGELVIQGDNLCLGYWNQPGATEEAFVDGWFHTNDVARRDQNGYLYIVDRKADMIISGGFNVYPKEVEDVIYRHPAVMECAVVSTPDERWGEGVKAYVALKPGAEATADEIIEFCANSGLGRYKKPRYVEFVDEIPKNPAGKVLRRVLKARSWEGRERSVS
jgi:acyl-CoA synthetase (AMP-forming)/AMP-acid ligase II